MQKAAPLISGVRRTAQTMNGSVLTVIKTVIEIIAFFAAGSYFIYKLIDGWGLVNLSLELSADRQVGEETDLVAVVLKLIKGDQGSLGLHTAELRCAVGPGDPEVFRIPLIYPLKLRTKGTHKDRHSLVEWSEVDEKRPHLHLPPGESTQYSHVFYVPHGATCTIEALVAGKRPLSTRMGQWRASVCVPPVLASPLAAVGPG